MVIGIDTMKSQPVYPGLPTIKVVGVGGGGGNVVNRMIQDNITGVSYVAMNTDVMALNSSLAATTLVLGNSITRGLGAGMRPEVGKISAEADLESIGNILSGTNMVFMAAGMGGGTGTGALPVIAEVAKEMEILTVAIVTTPFSFEGKKRSALAAEGIEELRKHVDTLIIVPNTRLLELASEKTTMSQAFAMADDVLKQAISGITNLINLEGMINLDFADLKTVMEDKGSAFMGTGSALGENRGLKAVQQAINSPLINRPITGATGIIINIMADQEFSLLDAEAAATYVQDSASEEANVIFGLAYNNSFVDEVSVTVIATGYEKSYKEKASGKYGQLPLRVADSLRHKALSTPNIEKTGRDRSPSWTATSTRGIKNTGPGSAPKTTSQKEVKGITQEKPVVIEEEIEVPFFMREKRRDTF
jgi:cell division protein FtsZ